MSEWISIEEKEIDIDKMHFLLDDENSIYIRGTEKSSFLFKLCGGSKLLCETNWTHWMPMPDLPK